MSTKYNVTSQTWEKMLDDRAFPIGSRVHSYRSMFDGRNEKNKNNYYKTVLRGVQERTLLSDLFFSKENVDYVNKSLRYAVYKISGKRFILGPQDTTELVIIMRSIFLNYCKNLACNIKEQIQELNNIVVQQTAPSLFTATQQYQNYLDAQKNGGKIVLPQPLKSRPLTELRRKKSDIIFAGTYQGLPQQINNVWNELDDLNSVYFGGNFEFEKPPADINPSAVVRTDDDDSGSIRINKIRTDAQDWLKRNNPVVTESNKRINEMKERDVTYDQLLWDIQENFLSNYYTI